MEQEYYFNINPKFRQNISSVIPLELNTDNCVTLRERKKEVLITARNVIVVYSETGLQYIYSYLFTVVSLFACFVYKYLPYAIFIK